MFNRPPFGSGSFLTAASGAAGSPASTAGDPGIKWKSPFAASTNFGSVAIQCSHPPTAVRYVSKLSYAPLAAHFVAWNTL